MFVQLVGRGLMALSHKHGDIIHNLCTIYYKQKERQDEILLTKAVITLDDTHHTSVIYKMNQVSYTMKTSRNTLTVHHIYTYCTT